MSKTDNPRPGSLYHRFVDDFHEVTVYPMTYGKARLCFGTRATELDDGSIDNGFCYEDPEVAVAAAMVWNGEGDPLDGWHRNPFDGRRREGGDPSKEEIRW